MKIIAFITLFIFNIFAYGNPLVIGVLSFAPPFSNQSGDGKHYYGFTIDLMNSICQQIKIDCVYKSTTMNTQLDALNNGDVDLIFTPSPISSNVNSNYIFSLPYLASDGQFLTLSENNINTLDDLKSKRVGVLSNTLYHALIQDKNNYENIKQYSGFSDLISGLINKEVDVIIMNSSVAHYVINNAMRNFKLVGNEIPVGEGYGILTLKKNADLINKINSALLNMESDGTYLAIYNKYFSE